MQVRVSVAGTCGSHRRTLPPARTRTHSSRLSAAAIAGESILISVMVGVPSVFAAMLPKLLEDLKPEAAYFYAEDGLRAGHFIVQMKDSTQILEIGERVWFALGGHVEMVPVMNGDDIQKAMPSLPSIVSKFG